MAGLWQDDEGLNSHCLGRFVRISRIFISNIVKSRWFLSGWTVLRGVSGALLMTQQSSGGIWAARHRRQVCEHRGKQREQRAMGVGAGLLARGRPRMGF